MQQHPAGVSITRSWRGTIHALRATSGSPSAGHQDHNTANGTTPVKSPVPIRMTPALNDHPIVAEILTNRARSISRNPEEEAIIIVAHGPNEDDETRRPLWPAADISTRAAAGRMAGCHRPQAAGRTRAGAGRGVTANHHGRRQDRLVGCEARYEREGVLE